MKTVNEIVVSLRRSGWSDEELAPIKEMEAKLQVAVEALKNTHWHLREDNCEEMRTFINGELEKIKAK